MLSIVVIPRVISRTFALDATSSRARSKLLRTLLVFEPRFDILFENAPMKIPQTSWGTFIGDPKGNRTPVAGMKTRCPNR